MLKASLSFNANNAPKTSISIKNSSNMLRLVLKLEFEVLKILTIGFFKHVQTCFKVLELQHDETL